MSEKYSALTEVVKSVAAEEKAAANLMRAEAVKLESAINKNATPAQLAAINESISRMFDELSQNNAELAKKMDTATGAPIDPADQPTAQDIANRKSAMNDIIESVADEESAMADMMNAEADKIRKIVTDPASTPEDMVKINDSGTALMDKIGNTNTELNKKLQKAVAPVN